MNAEIESILVECNKALCYDRDCLYDSVSLSDGTIPDARDREDLEKIDKLIDRIQSALRQRSNQNV